MSNETVEHELTDADRVAAAVRAVPAVVDLHGGALGEVGIHLPGRRISGIRERDGRWEIHVTARLGESLTAVSRQVRDAAAPHVRGAVIDVVIEDVSDDDGA